MLAVGGAPLGVAIICHCGHNKYDHQDKGLVKKGVKIRGWKGECMFYECGCGRFDQVNAAD